MRILIGIPLFNEQAYLSECITSLFQFLDKECQEYDIKVCLADDASTDNSQVIYERLSQEYPFNYIRHDFGPQGYGNTILTLFKHSKKISDILITFDADLQHAPFSIKEIIQMMETNSAIDVVSTSRYLSYRFWGQNTPVPVDRYFTNMLITRTINTCFNLNITDAFCGLKGYITRKLPITLDHSGYAFPLVYWQFLFKNKLSLREIETPIIYRLDRRTRGEWKDRMQEYYRKLETLVTTAELKQKVRNDCRKGIEKMTEILDHFGSFPIYSYEDFLRTEWLE